MKEKLELMLNGLLVKEKRSVEKIEYKAKFHYIEDEK